LAATSGETSLFASYAFGYFEFGWSEIHPPTIRNVTTMPEAKALIAPITIAFFTLLADKFGWRRPAKRRADGIRPWDRKEAPLPKEKGL